MTTSRIHISVVLAVLCGTPAFAQKPDLLQDANLKTLGCAAPDTKYAFVGSNQPGNVFYPEDQIDLRIKVTRTDQPLKSVTLAIIEIAMRQNRYLEGWSVMSKPTAVENLGSRGKVVVPVAVEDQSGATAETDIKNLSVPKRYGTYLITLAPNGRRPQFLCTLLRAHRPKPGFDVNAPVFGEGQFLTHDDQKPELVRQRAQTLARLGIKGIRIELGWRQDELGNYDCKRFDILLGALKEAKIKALVTMGGHPYIFRASLKHDADGIVARNLAGLEFFARRSVPLVADYSLNAANDLTVHHLRRQGAARVFEVAHFHRK